MKSYHKVVVDVEVLFIDEIIKHEKIQVNVIEVLKENLSKINKYNFININLLN